MPIKSIEAAASGSPWCVAGVIRDLEYVRDDEGRPVAERRAPSAVKAGAPMELRACPYHDERKGHPMNVSALAQITRYLEPVLDEIATFRATAAESAPTWPNVFAAVVDQLAGPALHLLQAEDPDAPVPALRAVGHKLAAGYYGLVQGLVVEEAWGRGGPVSVATFLEFVRVRKGLLGASEVCAGPPGMIARASAVLIDGTGPTTVVLDPKRVEIAHALADQMRTGLAWELFDRRHEEALLLDIVGRRRARPRNPFIARKLDRRFEEIGASDGPDRDVEPNYGRLLPSGAAALLDALTPRHRGLDLELIRCVASALDRDEGAVELQGSGTTPRVARALAEYLRVHRATVSQLWRSEMRLRELLGFPAQVPVKFDAAVFPRARALDWYEVFSGHRLVYEPGPQPDMQLRNHRREITLAGTETPPASAC